MFGLSSSASKKINTLTSVEKLANSASSLKIMNSNGYCFDNSKGIMDGEVTSMDEEVIGSDEENLV